MEKHLFFQIPTGEKNKLFRKTYYLSATALAHILERHYYKISRHPDCGKFTVDILTIDHWIKEAFSGEPTAIQGSLNFRRCIDTGIEIGFSRDGIPTSFITVFTDAGGGIKTAFPGNYQPATGINY